ncbi:D-alanyl-D-alanine endopeptidase [Achromobacter mucicolens]|jgi:D-alanyl-D-alanine endopeptidase (penicillin-binding protein 7)|uniref:D-alanyl-D-alanine endopeptidase n=1 Tax=Achromobacter mucicolens TaxID=1389922 RepID=A0ABD4YZV0_9BURK|nr:MULTISPECIES: D-alanyl-D-alanine endopeptidase [Achromobacter]MCP2515213.1 D-alanyl-D-alanine endopeptidase [Achromobacter mucicolens]MCU6616535.1 D-alanyl-D-alanine endopeptidase [Achromobacter mucicolens]MDF2863521.1 D-alanyl-D-alanine endopeptidase [Achromobacter mucicolens]MDG9967517.1 D-alanyl-D-alanine endopeptidase [Achromobacter mucicolens]MDH1181042.1 D-alanyl-D-alanine endopeptidase [Achromobacter mucicolens]
MAFSWKRAIANAIAPAALAVCALLPPAAQAAKNSDPCKTNAKSAACKAQQAKKAPAPKAGSGKSAAAKQAAPSAKKAPPKSSSAKKAPPKSGKQVAAKGTPPKKSGAAGKGGKTDKAARGRRVAAAGAASAAMPPPAASARAEAAALRSSTAYVQDLETSTVIFAKNENVVRPIASISKLMTAVVVVDANLPMDEMLEITDEDVDELKHTTSRLRVGTKLSRGDMLHLALMSSENRAANALGRHYPGGLRAFVAAMNAKAQSLGMTSTRFIEPTGLSSNNVSSPHDLARLLRAASQRPLIHRYSTDTEYEVEINNRTQTFRNTNLLVRKPDWDIKVSKTGYINEAGECLVMLARINGRDLAIVLLDSQGKLSRIGDAVRIRRIVQSEVAMASIASGG